MKILKYQIPLKEDGDYAGDYVISMPEHAEIIYVGAQNGYITLWVRVQPVNPSVLCTFKIIATGETIPDKWTKMTYIGTVLLGGGTFVWHIFE